MSFQERRIVLFRVFITTRVVVVLCGRIVIICQYSSRAKLMFLLAYHSYKAQLFFKKYIESASQEAVTNSLHWLRH